jgi:transposase InsO family protein
VLTDNGPEFTGKAFPSHLEHLGVRQHRIPPRSPNHNAVCKHFQRTALQEFYRPAFHRQHFARLADLNAQFQGGLQHYNTRRRNHGDSWAAARPLRSWRRTYHDHAEGPSVASSCALEALDLRHCALFQMR